LFHCVLALTVHDGGMLLVRAEQTSDDGDVMLVAPLPLKPQDINELNRQMQQVEGATKKRSLLKKLLHGRKKYS